MFLLCIFEYKKLLSKVYRTFSKIKFKIFIVPQILYKFSFSSNFKINFYSCK